MRIIWAYGEVDPGMETSVPYHGTTRGTKSTQLMSTQTQTKDIPQDTTYFDLTVNQVGNVQCQFLVCIKLRIVIMCYLHKPNGHNMQAQW